MSEDAEALIAAVKAKRKKADPPVIDGCIDVVEPLALPASPSIPDLKSYFQKPDLPLDYVRMEETEYHAYRGVSAGLLKNATPAHMLHYLGGGNPVMEDADEEEGEKQSAAKTLGTVVHALILEPQKFNEENFGKYFVKFTETKGLHTKAAKEAQKANPGKLLVTPVILQTAMRIRREAFETHPRAMEYLQTPDGITEGTGVCWDYKSKVRRRIRPDYIPKDGKRFGNYLADIKTTRKPPSQFFNEAKSFGYFIQAAWYMDTHELLTGCRVDYFYFIVLTTFPPYLCRVVTFPNYRHDHMLYEKSQLKEAREMIGLEGSRVGRLNMFTNAAQETLEALTRNENLSFYDTRRIWTGYEDENPHSEIL